MSDAGWYKQCARARMTETGENYTSALRAVKAADPAEFQRLKDKVVALRRARQAARGNSSTTGTEETRERLCSRERTYQ